MSFNGMLDDISPCLPNQFPQTSLLSSIIDYDSALFKSSFHEHRIHLICMKMSRIFHEILLTFIFLLDIIRNKKIRWDKKNRSAKSSFLPYFLDLFRLQKQTFCTPDLISNNVYCVLNMYVPYF